MPEPVSKDTELIDTLEDALFALERIGQDDGLCIRIRQVLGKPA